MFRAFIDQSLPTVTREPSYSPPHIDLIQTFSHNPGDNDEIFTFEYDDEDGSYPLSNSVTSVAFPTGAAAQDDEIKESDISATGVVGKNASRPERHL